MVAKGKRHLALGAAVVAAFATFAGVARPVEFRFLRPAEPAGLSGLTHAGGERYFAVDDRGGRLYELTIALDAGGGVRAFATNRCVRLAGRVDLEGCAWDPLERRIWAADEADASVRQFDPETGAETAVAPLPDVFRREAVPNRSVEALAISSDGLRMYAANEDTLRCDGAVATTNRGGVVRIQEFSRDGAGCPWKPARQFRHRTRRIRGREWRGLARCGVSALAVDSDGSLLILEREFSRKGLPVPTFSARLVRLETGEGRETVLWKRETGFANYEGLAPGPVLPDGTCTWLLASDAGGGAEAGLLVLGFRPLVADPPVAAPATTIVVQPLADEDFLEPSVQNEVDHARALVPTNALARACARDYALIGTSGVSRTALAIRLVSLQRPDGRFRIGTNDVTSAAARLLDALCGAGPIGAETEAQ